MSDSAATRADIADPLFRVIRIALHRNRIGCRDSYPQCPGVMSVLHNRDAKQVVSAIDHARVMRRDR